MADGPPDRLRGSVKRGRERRSGEPARVALAVARTRNAELLRDLLADHDVVAVGTEIPAGTDLCIVDPAGFADVREALVTWKRRERPATAPVLLVAEATENGLWTRYAEAMGESLDAIQTVPAPRQAVLARVEGLLGIRRESLLAADRRARLELYERAMNGAHLGITIADAGVEDRPLVYVNDGFEELTGYDRAEVLGRNCRFLQGPDTDPETVRQLREAIAAEEPVSVEIRNYRQSGEPFWNRVEVVPVRGSDGEVTHFIGFQRDVTERKDREELLAEYESIVQSVNDPILVLDTDGTVHYTNEAAERVFGSGTTGVAVAELFAPRAAAAVEEMFDAVVETGEELTRDITVSPREGLTTVYQFRLQPETFRDETRIIVVARDITDITHQQERLSVLDRVLRHNLRNKLNVVMGHARTLAEDPIDEPETVAALAERIEAAADTLLELSDAARRFDVSTDPNGSPGEEVDVAEFVRAMAPELAEAHPTAAVSTDLPASAMAQAPSQLGFCVEELVDSAAARGAGTPSVVMSVWERGDQVNLRVSDDGERMPDVERRALSAGTETPLEHTQGIELWLVRWAVEGVGGRFRVEDTEDGTAVVLTFPAVR